MHSVLTGPLYLKALIISTTVDAPSARKAIQLATTMEDSAFGMLKVIQNFEDHVDESRFESDGRFIDE